MIYFQEDLSDLVLGYANYFIGSTGENNTGQGDVNIKFGLEYQGQFYPFFFSGTRVARCADGATISTDPLSVSILAGTYGAIRMWEQKVNPTQNNTWLWSSEADPAFNEGTVTSSDPNHDWTLGGSPGETAALSWTIDGTGKVTPTIVNPGSGITVGGVTISILDSMRKGTGFGYIATVSGGSLSGWYQANGGSGYSHSIWVGPSGMGGYGSGGPQQAFGPSVIAGTPVAAKKSILLIGDSISAGYGATDPRGDIYRNFGIYARSISTQYNVCNSAIPGLTAYACDYNYSRTRNLIKAILNPQVALICIGTNDVDQAITDSGSKTVVNALKGHLSSIANWWSTNCGSSIWFGTILPRVNITGSTQTPRTGFEAGGNADQVNTAILNGTIFPASRIISGRKLVQDPANNSIWRTDHGTLTSDGTHPNDATGIPWISTNLFLNFETEALAVPQTSGDTHRIISAPDFSADDGTILDANAVGDYVIYTVPNVSAGTYRVLVGIKAYNTRGIWQLSIGRSDNFAGTASNVGAPQDEYTAGEVYQERDLGLWSPGTTSDKWFKFAVTGKNASSVGYGIAFDYIKLLPQ